MRGMALYVRRHDGTAAPCEDCVHAMQDAAQEVDQEGAQGKAPLDFSQFRRWYHQAGTPVLRIQRHWDGEAGVLELHIQQHTPPTPGDTRPVLRVTLPTSPQGPARQPQKRGGTHFLAQKNRARSS